jgi:maltose O-acetyltransferase
MSLRSYFTGLLRSALDKYRRKARRAHIELLKSRGLKIGANGGIEDGVFLDPSHCYLIEIGERVIFAPNVRLIAHDASTKYVVGYTRLGRIVVGSRVFLGDSVTILGNVKIGDDCIIGAGAVVTKDIPSGSVAAGNPARVICTIEEYRARHQAALAAGTLFEANAAAETCDADTRRRVLEALGRGPVYMP